MEAVLLAIGAAVLVALFGIAFRRPREYIVEFWRAGRGRPRSRFHIILGSHWPSVWMVVPSGEGPKIAWQCELTVTNGGNREDAPVRGELRWGARATVFTTPLRPTRHDQPSLLASLAPEEAGVLMVNAWTSLEHGDDPAGELRADIVLYDRYGGDHRTQVTFGPAPPAPPRVTPLGECGMSADLGARLVYCDLPADHEGEHVAHDEVNGMRARWEREG
jgi:hypothetical protein